jgi:hypothetical protein
MALFRVEAQEEGTFKILTIQDDEEICTVKFAEPEMMGGALGFRAQRSMVLKFSQSLHKACVDHWRKEE